MAGDEDLAQSAVSDAVSETAEDGLERKVTVEVVHKHDGSSVTTWTIIMLVVLGLAGGAWVVFSGGGDGGGILGFGGGGNCGDGIDNDSDGRIDQADGDCYDEVSPKWSGYKESHSEDGRNDPPGGQS